MKYCSVCKLDIRGKHDKCPLCQSNLTPAENDKDSDFGDIFPVIPTIFEQYKLIIKLAVFISISVSVIAISINLMIPHNRMWSFFAVFGIGCVLFSFIIALQKRNNILKNMYNQVIIISVFSVFWDFITEWRGWSIDFVIPILLGFNIILMLVTAQITRIKIEDYIFYLLVNSVGGLIPLIFLALDITKVVYPSYICIILSLISLTALGVFYGNKLISEVKKRFHM